MERRSFSDASLLFFNEHPADANAMHPHHVYFVNSIILDQAAARSASYSIDRPPRLGTIDPKTDLNLTPCKGRNVLVNETSELYRHASTTGTRPQSRKGISERAERAAQLHVRL
jgi:hypothetical protein